MMGRLTTYQRMRIINLSNKGFKPPSIVKLLRNEDILITRQTINRILKRHREHGRTLHCQKSGRQSKITKQIKNFIDRSYDQNGEYSARELQKLIETKFNTVIAVSSIKTVRRKLGWRKSGPGYCQTIRPGNRIKRFLHAQACLENNEDFDDVIFTDECTIEIDLHAGHCFVKHGVKRRLKPKPKHSYKVHVWGGISRRGRTRLLIFTGIMGKVSFFPSFFFLFFHYTVFSI